MGDPQTELTSHVSIEKRIEADFGVKIPEFKPYPEGHDRAGSIYEVTSYDPKKKAFSMKLNLVNRGRRYMQNVDYMLIPNTKALARRERDEPQPENQKVQIQYTDGNFRLEYNLSASERKPGENGSFGSYSSGAFMAVITYEQHPDEPEYYRGSHLRNELARLYLDSNRGSRVIYPAYYSIEEYMALLREGRDHNATDRLSIAASPLKGELKYLVANPQSHQGYDEKTINLEPGKIYSTTDKGYHQMKLDITEDAATFVKLDSPQGPGTRIVIPGSGSIDRGKALKTANGDLEEWVGLRNDYTFTFEMFDHGLQAAPKQQILG